MKRVVWPALAQKAEPETSAAWRKFPPIWSVPPVRSPMVLAPLVKKSPATFSRSAAFVITMAPLPLTLAPRLTATVWPPTSNRAANSDPLTWRSLPTTRSAFATTFPSISRVSYGMAAIKTGVVPK